MNAKSVIREFVRQMEEQAKKHTGGRVVSLKVRVGELSGVDPVALSNAYAAEVEDTAFETTRLTLETVVPEAVCEQCGNKFRFDQARNYCDKCGSLRLALHGGDELLLESVLMED